MSDCVTLHGFGGSRKVSIYLQAYATAAERAAAKPGENTIGIITATPITGYVLSATVPEASTEGCVWIRTGLSSAAAFDVLPGSNALMVYPQSAKQYVKGAWTAVNAESYQAGKWVTWNIPIVAEGKTEADIRTLGVLPEESGGYKGNLTVSQNAANLTIAFAPGTEGYGSGAIAHFGKYDLTAFHRLIFEGSLTKSAEDGAAGLAVWSSVEGITCFTQNRVKHTALTSAATLDVSELSGEHVIGFFYQGAFAMTHTITGLRLEA